MTKRKNVYLFLGLVGILALKTLTTACSPAPIPTRPPSPVQAVLKFGSYSYNCFTGTPTSRLGSGTKMRMQVATNFPDGRPDFYHNALYSGTSSNSITVETYNGTTYNPANYSVNMDCLGFEVPSEGTYTATVYVIETGGGNCGTPPAANGCFRWFRQLSFNNGVYPYNCGVGVPLTIINEVDPDGFVGPCQ